MDYSRYSVKILKVSLPSALKIEDLSCLKHFYFSENTNIIRSVWRKNKLSIFLAN